MDVSKGRLLIALAVAAALVAALTLRVLHVIEARWQEAVATAGRLQARLDAEPRERPVLWGEALPGAAWPEYRRAFRAMGRAAGQARRTEIFRAAKRDPEEARALRDAWLAEHRETLALLSRAAHRRLGRRTVDWALGFGHRIENLLDARELANLAVYEAQALHERGEDAAAARVLLDAMQLGGDFMRSSFLIEQMIGVALLRIAGKDAVEGYVPLAELSPEGLEVLAAGCERLAESLPAPGAALAAATLGDVVLFVRHVQNLSPGEPLWGKPLGLSRTWRYLFSDRLMYASFVDEVVEVLGNPPAGSDWGAFRTWARAGERRLGESSNPLVPLLFGNTLGMARNHAEARLLFELIRMAIADRLGRPLDRFTDPLGGELRREVDGGAVRYFGDGAPVDRRERLSLEVPLAPVPPGGR